MVTAQVPQPLAFWYNLTAPVDPGLEAPLIKREIARRGRIISLIMLVVVWLAIFPIFFQPAISVMVGVMLAIIVDMIALIAFNRRGKIVIAAFIITGMTEVGMLLTLMAQSQLSLSMGFVPFLALLIQPTAVAASTLRPKAAFGIFIFNISIVILFVLYAPHGADIVAYLHTPQGLEGLIVTPLEVLQVSYFVVIIWVISANSAIKRADEATARANYAEQLAVRDRLLIDQKEELEQNLREIITIITRVANNSQASLTVSPQNRLWPIATALRIWHKRQQQNLFETQKLMRIEKAAAMYLSLLKAGAPLSAWESTGTSIDDIVHAGRLRETNSRLMQNKNHGNNPIS